MYLAPLNYDRFFYKLFSDELILRRFLEDVLGTTISEMHPLTEPSPEQSTQPADDAGPIMVELVYRCNINGSWVIIDLQHWYMLDITQRFHLRHDLNNAMEEEDLGGKPPVFPAGSDADGQMDPVLTLIWAATDTLGFTADCASYLMDPETVLDFIENEQLWYDSRLRQRLLKWDSVLDTLPEDVDEPDLLRKNRLLFMFQANIANIAGTERGGEDETRDNRYARWFELAEKSRNPSNTGEDFAGYMGDDILAGLIGALRRDRLSDADVAYIGAEDEHWETLRRQEQEFYARAKAEAENETETDDEDE